MWLFGASLVAILLVLGFACVFTPATAEATAGPPAPTPVAVPRRRSVPVLVLFASPSDDDVLLDCIAGGVAMLGPGTELHPGTPFTVRAARTMSAPWADAMIDTVLTRWAETSARVEMVLLDGPGGPEVRLYDDSTRVQLPIAA